MLQVREISQIDELRELRTAWTALLRRTAGASFFQSLEWLEAYGRHFGREMTFRVLVVGDPACPEGILPLVVYPEKTRIGRLRVLSYPLHDWGSFYGPIGPDPASTLLEGLGHIRRCRRDWDFVELRWCGAPGADLRHYDDAMQAAGLQSYATIWDQTAVVDLRGDWPTYFAGRPSSLRNNFRRRQKHLARLGTLRFERYRPRGEMHGDANPRWDLYDACERLAGRSWQASSTEGTTLSSDSIRPFLREVHAEAVRLGAVDMNLLWLNDRLTAFAYNYHWQGYVSGLRVGFDSEFAGEGVGGLLWTMSIRDSFERGDRIYDLGAGSLDVKRHYRTDVLPIFRFGHYPAMAPRTQLLRLRRWAQGHLLGEDAALALCQGTALAAVD